MLTFTTDEVPVRERFDHWCEVRGKSLFGVTIELPRERRADFYGRFSARGVGNAIVSDMQASSYEVRRTEADIARVSGDSLCIGYQVRGPGWMDFGRDRVQLVHEGDLTISHSDLPFGAIPVRQDGFVYRMLKIPLTGDVLLGATARDLVAQRCAAGAPYLRPFAALFKALTEAGSEIDDPAAEVANVARLAMLLRGRLPAGLPESRAALRSGCLHAARAILARDLHRADLSPAMVAQELGISLRQVHVVFEPTGLSFARTLTKMRVAQARRLLQAEPERPVAEIVFACGFDSLATFYRVFRQAYDMTPNEMRSARE
ncbi:AraC family transcriptional regulator [Bradyrhizobium sp.]|uniref:helix-turn-helix transcriptional regulator n=1 Tax=Bradyrhizobium sp. TaxID=376 RepID=UPI0039E58B24